MKRLVLPAVLAIATMMAATASAQTTYNVRFQSEWSVETHPSSFPPSPHMSPLIGATHNASYVMWEPGGTATNGIEVMAESGGTTPLRNEINGRIGFGSAHSVIAGGGIGVSPGTSEANFEITASHPLVSLVSMIAPSPDWFVGVHGLSLVENGEWINSLVVDLLPYDSGTDSGANYTSANADTDPAEPITALTESPFRVNNQVRRIGTFTFTCMTGCGVVTTETEDPAVTPSGFTVGQPYPNPSIGTSRIAVDLPKASAFQLSVVDLLGRRVWSAGEGRQPAGRHEFVLPTSEWSSGLYMVRVQSELGNATRQVVVLD